MNFEETLRNTVTLLENRLSETLETYAIPSDRIRKIGALVREVLDENKDKISGILAEDVRAFRERDPAATSDEEVMMLYSGFHALEMYRVAHAMHEKGYIFEARAVSQAAKFITGVEIHPAAKIGRGLVIDHGAAVVIGETAEIGDDCTLYQGVTLGGTGKDTGKRHPTLGNHVLVGSGAKVLGPFKVGDNAKIAAGAVVLKEIPANCTAVGIPAKIVRNGKAKVSEELDQIHTPDPVEKEIRDLSAKVEALEKELSALRKQKLNEN